MPGAQYAIFKCYVRFSARIQDDLLPIKQYLQIVIIQTSFNNIFIIIHTCKAFILNING